MLTFSLSATYILINTNELGISRPRRISEIPTEWVFPIVEVGPFCYRPRSYEQMVKAGR
jgi:hypothetical protein